MESRKLVELSGARLVCVRYRDDEPLQKRFNTIGRIVEEALWTPKRANREAFKPEEIVGLKNACGEVETGRNVMAASGKRNLTKRFWELAITMLPVLDWKNESKKHSLLETKRLLIVDV